MVKTSTHGLSFSIISDISIISNQSFLSSRYFFLEAILLSQSLSFSSLKKMFGPFREVQNEVQQPIKHTKLFWRQSNVHNVQKTLNQKCLQIQKIHNLPPNVEPRHIFLPLAGTKFTKRKTSASIFQPDTR